MPQKELYLHIGTHKTGTTALQRFFAVNQKPLRDRGIVYPNDADGGVEDGHYRLWWSLRMDRGVIDERCPKNLRCADREWRAVLKQFNAERMLISAEGLWNCKPEDILKIKTITGEYLVKIIVYLRRQDTLAVSVYNQLIKGKAHKQSASMCDYRMDYSQALQCWAEVFGKKNLLVRPYERNQFYQKSIFADFLHHVFDMEMDNDFYVPQSEINSHLHRIAFEYKRLVNYLPIPSRLLRYTLKPLLEVFELLCRQGRVDMSNLSPQEQLDILKRYTTINESVARDYMGRTDGRLFYDPVPDINRAWQPYGRLNEKDAILINEYLLERHPDVACLIIKGLLGALSSKDQAIREAAGDLLPGILNSPLDTNGRFSALERKLSETAARCKGKRFRNWIIENIPGSFQKPARIVVREFRRLLRA